MWRKQLPKVLDLLAAVVGLGYVVEYLALIVKSLPYDGKLLMNFKPDLPWELYGHITLVAAMGLWVVLKAYSYFKYFGR